MIELRWLRINEYRDGAIDDRPYEWKILQYRTKEILPDISYHAKVCFGDWTDWQDVPMVREEEG